VTSACKTSVRNASSSSKRGSGLARIVCSLSLVALCAKVFGLTEKLVIAHYFGTSGLADVYFGATATVFSVVFLAKELIYPVLVPALISSWQISAEVGAALFRKTFRAAAGVLTVLTLALMLASGRVTGLFMPGFRGVKHEMAAELLRALGPVMVFWGLTMVASAALNAHRRFLHAAWPEVGLKAFIVVSLAALLPGMGICAYPIIMQVGTLLCLIVQLFFLPEAKALGERCPVDPDGDVQWRRMLGLMSPLVLGIVFSHVNALVDNGLASGLPSGQLSYLGYSKKLVDAILLVGPVALVTVVFSQLSHLASRKDRAQLQDLVSKAFRLTIYLSVPASCLLAEIGQPLIRLLLQRGAFTAESTLGTTRAFTIYIVGLVVLALEPLLIHCFFALADTRTPVKAGVVCVVLNIGLAVILVRKLEYLGIAGAFFLAKALKVVALTYLLNRRLNGLLTVGLAGFLVKQGFIAGCVWGMTRLLLQLENADSAVAVAVFDLLIPSAGALAMLLLCSCLVRSPELTALLSVATGGRRAAETVGGRLA
jgi:putative peptidoglycan lipid II flippase